MDLLSLVAVPALAYLAMAALVAVDALVPALPSEVLVVSAGALAAAGHLDVGWAIAAAAAGAVAGDLTVYAVSRRTLPAALDRSRIGRRMRARIDRAHQRMGSTSTVAIIAGRFVPLGRTTIAAAAGVAGVRPRRFSAAALAGCVMWAGWTVGLGFVTGRVTDIPLWLQVGVGVAIGVLVGIWAGAVQAIVRTRRRMSERNVELGDEPEPSRTAELVG